MDYKCKVELPVNYKAEELVIGTLFRNNMIYGSRTIDYAIDYIDKNWFCDSFYQDVFTVIKDFTKDHKNINQMDIAQYMIEHDMGNASDIYKNIHAINECCSEDEMFWKFVKLIERLYYQRQLITIAGYFADKLEGRANE